MYCHFFKDATASTNRTVNFFNLHHHHQSTARKVTLKNSTFCLVFYQEFCLKLHMYSNLLGSIVCYAIDTCDALSYVLFLFIILFQRLVSQNPNRHVFDLNIFGTKITEIIFTGSAKLFRENAFRMELCPYIYMLPYASFG